MAYAGQAMPPAAPLPYTVRNTFIDVEGPGEEHHEGIFSTWHHPARRQDDLEDGQLPDADAGASKLPEPLEASRGAPPRPGLSAAGARAALRPAPEDGEIIEEEGEIPEDEEDLEDGELPASEPEAAPGQADALGAAGGDLPSRGSAGHAAGTCRPCAWMHKADGGCRTGQGCEYCHLCPPGELKRRKQEKMQRRMAEINQARERQGAKEGAAEGGQGAGANPASKPAGTAQAVANMLQTMEPCYIEVPGLTASTKGRMSAGSMEHASGTCRPCAWVHKDAGGCKNGASCQYCHLCPPGELKRRKRQKWELKS